MLKDVRGYGDRERLEHGHWLRLRQYPDFTNGYWSVSLKTATSKDSLRDVHRLVLQAWSGPPPGDKKYACHIKPDIHDNRPCNLKWGTKEENDKAVKLASLNLSMVADLNLESVSKTAFAKAKCGSLPKVPLRK
jgi:hypothetical protein